MSSTASRPLQPAQAQNANAYAVTQEYAEQNNLTTLSDLGKLGKPIALAAASDCADRPECGKGLDERLRDQGQQDRATGFGTSDTKNALSGR